jgi:potassium-transporting ATPase KdpC subunit
MTQLLLTSLRVFIVFAILLGLVYPMTIAKISQVFMPEKANGSLITKDGRIIGSELIGQNFTAAGYFNGRFSDVNYNAATSGSANLGPSNQKLFDRTAERIKKVRAINKLAANAAVPADAVLSSGSGLDPHISFTNAMMQLPRVAAARKLSQEKLKQLVLENATPDFVGIWGTACVNVLQLNLALDDLKQ